MPEIARPIKEIIAKIASYSHIFELIPPNPQPRSQENHTSDKYAVVYKYLDFGVNSFVAIADIIKRGNETEIGWRDKWRKEPEIAAGYTQLEKVLTSML